MKEVDDEDQKPPRRPGLQKHFPFSAPKDGAARNIAHNQCRKLPPILIIKVLFPWDLLPSHSTHGNGAMAMGIDVKVQTNFFSSQHTLSLPLPFQICHPVNCDNGVDVKCQHSRHPREESSVSATMPTATATAYLAVWNSTSVLSPPFVSYHIRSYHNHPLSPCM